MKYTKEQAEKLKNKGMDNLNDKNPLPDVTIKDGYYVVESYINKTTN